MHASSTLRVSATRWRAFAPLSVALAAALLGSFVCPAQGDPPKNPSVRWEKDIAAMEAQDAKSPPAPGGIVFVGSSSIRKWDLSKSFPDLPVLNRGFGGSQLADSVYFAPRIVLPYKPRAVVVYAGDNDIAQGKSPEKIAGDYRELVTAIHSELPKTKVIYIAIKPSIARWKLVDKVRAANKLIAAEADKDEREVFVDIDPAMIGSDGQPRPEFFLKDGLHLTDAGYEAWAALIKPHLAGD